MRQRVGKGLSPIDSDAAAPHASASPEKPRDRKGAATRLSNHEVTQVFTNLATLLENGVSLPKALGALSEERSLDRCRDVLLGVRRRLESGDLFSTALAEYKSCFDSLTVNQVKVGERSGALGEALTKIAEQRQKAGKLRGEVVKKLAYPIILVLVGVVVIAFLLTYVVPVFEETYRSAKVELPGITQALILVGSVTRSYGWLVVLASAAFGLGIAQLRRNDDTARAIDSRLLKLPVIGPWLRDIAVLELMNVLGNLMEAGFTLADALSEAADSVSNRAVKGSVRDLHRAVNRGERFSREVERHGELFSPMVSQLVIVGEQSGKLTKATQHIRAHLHEEIERKTTLFVGVIEPVLTISLASAVGMVLLAIYLPMFDMINAVGG